MTTGRTPQQILAAVYDEGAAAYEKYWAPVLHRHALDLVNTVTSAAAPAPHIVVDVATGAGTLVPALRGLAGSGGRVIALDRSHGMLRRIPQSVPRVQADAAHCHFVRRPRTSWCPRRHARAALALKTGCGVLGWRYRRLDAASQEAVHRRAAERLAALPSEAFIDRSEVLLTTARRTR